MNGPKNKVKAGPCLVLFQSDPEQRFLQRGSISAFWTVDPGCGDEFINSPFRKYYFERGIPVMAEFARLKDAEYVKVRLGSGAVVSK